MDVGYSQDARSQSIESTILDFRFRANLTV